MKKILFYTLGLLLTFAVGCRKDEITTDTSPNPPSPIEVSYTDSGVYGQVTDRAGNPISAATVSWGSQTTQTNESGFFTAESNVKERNAVLTVRKEGFYEAIQTLHTIDGEILKTTVKLTPRNLSGSLQATAGGTIETNDGARIEFAAGFVDQDGNAYTGTVNVFAYFLDPTIDDLQEVMPGNLGAINAQNEQQILKSFGMINVELEDQAGNPLQINQAAQLITPVPASLSADAPAIVPLWHFDTELGLWREEGAANLQGDVYVSEVNHFTWWNVDVPSDFVFLEGQVSAGDQTPVFSIKITQISNNTYGITNTVDKGNFAGNVPANELLLLEVISPCGDVIYSEEVGPFNSDTVLDLITLDDVNLTYLTISGQLVNCDAEGVTEGYVAISSTQFNQLTLPDAAGNWSVTIVECEAVEEITYYGVDVAGSFSSNAETVALTDNNTDLGQIVACDNEVLESFDFTYDGNSESWTPCTVFIENLGGGDTEMYNITTTDVQENGTVIYSITIINWADNPTTPAEEWVIGVDTEIIGGPSKIFYWEIGDQDSFEIVSNDGTPGSTLHMTCSDVTVSYTDENGDSFSYSEETLDIKATIQ